MKSNLFRMSAEWEPQAAVWLSWPHNIETWPTNLAQAQSEFVTLVKAIAAKQPVFILAASSRDPEVPARCQTALGGVENVTLLDIPTNDAWARDYAPTFVKKSNGELAAIDWHYNAWGGKYPPFDDDQKVCALVAEYLGIEIVDPKFCFEGGAIEVNTNGVLLSTKSCALDPNRNPDPILELVDGTLARHLGTTKHIWLSGDAIEGDDTDGHVDQLARFVDDQTIVYAWTREEDPQYAGLAKNLADLQRELSSAGLEHIRLIPLLIPTAIQYYERRIPASYCNFLITNELVIVPQFGQPEDDLALAALIHLFPSRTVVGLDSLNLSVGLGSFHCLSQNQPA